MNPYYTIDHLPGRTIRLEDREFLFFSGTSYLGMAQNPAFRALLEEGMARYGTVFGSSRNGNLRLAVYEEAEDYLAQFAGSEAALTFSSGMMAGQAVVNWLRAEGFGFIYGPNAHPAIWQELTTTLPQVSFAEWTAQLPHLVRAATGSVAIALNSLDAVRSEAYSFDWVAELPEDQSITLLVDDSHGLGVIGPEGRGIWNQIVHRPNVRLIVTASLAKAMGLPGGVVLADSATVQAIRRTAFFGACSPIPPAYLDALLRAQALYRTAFEQLQRNVRYLEQRLEGVPIFQHISGYPVFYTVQDALYAFLLEKQILIYSFAYPAPTDRPNTRLVVSALHQTDDLEQLAVWVSKVVADSIPAVGDRPAN